nr:putative O-glycosylation ligase, exosortase A system-associated [uncultured Roseateles sp.]
MRTILVAGILFGILPFILWRARIGAYAWAWIAMMVPHRLAYGFVQTMPFAQLVAIFTLISTLASRDKRPFPVNSITVTQILFLVWMSITSLFAMSRPEWVLDQWIFVLKIHFMLFVTMLLLRGRKQIEMLIWVTTLSIGYYGIKGGVFTLLTGGGSRVWGPPGGVISGNNELGIALVLVLPFMYYLYQTMIHKMGRRAMVLAMLLMCVGILGTQSRGALLSVVAMGMVLGLKGKNRVKTVLAIVVLAGVAVMFMPDSWTNRMNSIQTYQQDSSAMSRIYTWKTLWNMALDRPITGAGFGTDNPVLFSMYAPPGGVEGYPVGVVFVAHSIYLQALGEHGFPGLAIYLLLGFITWRKAASIAKKTANDPEYAAWVPLLMRMVQVSLVGFAVGGAFLTLVHFDLPYYIICYVVLVDATLRERAVPVARRA